jgi:hypothetical protein
MITLVASLMISLDLARFNHHESEYYDGNKQTQMLERHVRHSIRYDGKKRCSIVIMITFCLSQGAR